MLSFMTTGKIILDFKKVQTSDSIVNIFTGGRGRWYMKLKYNV
jgi:hypothetical protein